MLATRVLLLALNLIAIIPLGIWIAFRGFKNAECRYVIYLLINFAFDVLANLIAPLLPIFAKSPENPVNHRAEDSPEQLSFLFRAPSRTAHGFVRQAIAKTNPHVNELTNTDEDIQNPLFHTFAPSLIENFNAAT